MSRSSLPAWQRLRHLAVVARDRHLRDLWHDPARATAFSREAGPLMLDFSKQRLSATELEALLDLAQACSVPAAVASLLEGAPVNLTEGRPALHSALRAAPDECVRVAGRNVIPDVQDSLARMESVVHRVHSRQWRGWSGRSITDVVNIGVGGSDLGAYMACTALGEFAAPEAPDLRLHFVSSIDGTQIADLLRSLRPETTLFIVSSKSFTTVDTMSNARTALQWMTSENDDVEMLLRHHFIGVSANSARMSEWGLPEANQIVFWDCAIGQARQVAQSSNAPC